MTHDLTYGDVIRQGRGRAMFIHYVWDYGGDHGKVRPGQRVVIVSDAAMHTFSLRRGEVVTVNWLDMEGNEPPNFRVEP